MPLTWTESLNYRVTLSTQACINCGVPFAIPDDLNEQLRRSKATFYCPNGHPQAYVESPEDQLRRELAAKEDRLQRVRRERDQAKAELTRARKRAAAAVCPAPGCKRTIQQMARHLRTKHPDYQPS